MILVDNKKWKEGIYEIKMDEMFGIIRERRPKRVEINVTRACVYVCVSACVCMSS